MLIILDNSNLPLKTIQKTLPGFAVPRFGAPHTFLRLSCVPHAPPPPPRCCRFGNMFPLLSNLFPSLSTLGGPSASLAAGATLPTAAGATLPTAAGATLPTAAGATLPTAAGATLPTAAGATLPTAAGASGLGNALRAGDGAASAGRSKGGPALWEDLARAGGGAVGGDDGIGGTTSALLRLSEPLFSRSSAHSHGSLTFQIGKM